MSAFANDTVANRLSVTGLSYPANTTVLLMGWGKRTAARDTTNTIMLDLAAGAGENQQPHIRLIATTSYGASVVNGNIYGIGAPTIDGWSHFAAYFGPWDGTTRPMAFFLDGTFRSNWNITVADQTSSVMTSLAVFNRNNWPAGGQWPGRIAEVAIFSGLNTTQRDAVITEAQTKHVGDLSIAPTHSWRLLNNRLAAAGGVDLTETGTITYDQNDHPPVGTPPPPASAARRRLVWID